MKLEDIIWDVKHMLMALAETTTVLDGDIIDKLAAYRMEYIMLHWNKNRSLLEDWFQNLGVLNTQVWNIFPLPLIVLVPGEEYIVVSGTVNEVELAEVHVTVTYQVGQKFILKTERNPELGGGYYQYQYNGTIYPTNPVEIAKYPANALYPQSYDTAGGKYPLPKIINFPDTLALRVYKTVFGSPLYPMPMNQLLMMIEMSDRRNQFFSFFSYRENTIYVYPKSDINCSAILQEPTAIADLHWHEVIANGSLVLGQRYVIESGYGITYPVNGVNTNLQKGAEFVGTELASWTENGQDPLQNAVIKKARTHSYFDEYPLDVAGIEYCILQMLTKDYKLRAAAISDVLQDDQDQFKILTARS